MKTVKTYMVRKSADLDEVKAITRTNSDKLEMVAVVETITQTPAKHKKLCQHPFTDYGFLKGKACIKLYSFCHLASFSQSDFSFDQILVSGKR